MRNISEKASDGQANTQAQLTLAPIRSRTKKSAEKQFSMTCNEMQTKIDLPSRDQLHTKYFPPRTIYASSI